MPMTAAATTIVLWASAFVVIRDVAAEISPPALVLGGCSRERRHCGC